ncbi:MAG TPA: GxxExxY protein [Gemmatimonadaceae bacterium]|nr:GxxExxY protein [Gemmatimonadaceae bacterium]
MATQLLEGERVRSIVGAFYTVYDYYGFGLAEAVYAGALELELIRRGHACSRELTISVAYHGRHVAWQRLDMVIDERVIVENKATEVLPPYAERQLLNYLRASPFPVGLLLHFGPVPKFRRFVDSRKDKAPFALVRQRSRRSRQDVLEPSTVPITVNTIDPNTA